MPAWPLPYPGESDAHFARRTARGYRDLPEAYHLHRFEWQIFGHLTFDAERMSTDQCRGCFHTLMRQVAKKFVLYFPTLCWALRFEHGTRGDRPPHIHFLIARLPERVDLKTFCRTCLAEWLKRGGGISQVTPYDRTLDGAGYIAKCSNHDRDFVAGECELTFSEAAKEYLRRVA